MAPAPYSPSLEKALEILKAQFSLDQTALRAIRDEFLSEMRTGLSNEGHPVAMIPSYVTGVPDGSEIGTFLALDLGGTNLRVCEVTLKGNHQFSMKSQKYKVSESLKLGDVYYLFDFIAECVDAFLREVGTDVGEGEDLGLGFTFSFPVDQTDINKGKLLTWTKGFQCQNAIGNDVVELLQTALDRKHLHVQCTALVNDTVGTLLARSYQSGAATVGAIFGTGTNGAYLENLSSFSKLKNPSTIEGTMICNTEWGATDNARRTIPITSFDAKLDRESINPRKQCFEKLISGMFLGEMTRNVLLWLIDLSILFKGYSSPLLNTHYGLDTSFMSQVEAAADDLSLIRKIIIKELAMEESDVTVEDADAIGKVVSYVGTRAASLSACALSAVMIQTGFEKSSSSFKVGMDGSVAELYPHFKERLISAMELCIGPEAASRVELGMAKDGSGVGAALCALQARKQGVAQNRHSRRSSFVR